MDINNCPDCGESLSYRTPSLYSHKYKVYCEYCGWEVYEENEVEDYINNWCQIPLEEENCNEEL